MPKKSHKHPVIENCGAKSKYKKRMQVRIPSTDKRVYLYGNTDAEVIAQYEQLRNGVVKENRNMTLKALLQGYLINNNGEDVLNDDYVAIDKPLQTNTVKNYKNSIKFLQKCKLDGIKVDDLNALKWQHLVTKMKANGYCNRTVQDVLKRIRAALRAYGFKDILDRLPDISHLNFGDEEYKEPKQLPTIQQVRDVVKGTNFEIASELSMLCGGFRKSEVLAFTYSDLSEENGQHFISCHATRYYAEKQVILKPTPKNICSNRKVPVPDWLYNKICNKVHFSDDEFIINCKVSSFGANFSKLLRKNGIDITYHCLRKMFARNLIMNLDLNSIAKLGGWKQGSDVLREVYLKVTEQDANNELINYWKVAGI